ncbi:MAG: hypothetical protein AAGA03_14340 [Planctomycetota bacterium]
MPVSPDLLPASNTWNEAIIADVSATGLALYVATNDMSSTRIVVVRRMSRDGLGQFALLSIQTQTSHSGSIRLGGRWMRGSASDLFDDAKLRPTLDAGSLTFRYGWPEEVLRSWAKVGVLKPFLMDRVLLCKQCQSLPSWRMGCPECGSGRTHQERQFRHFACGHSDKEALFKDQQQIRCPQCQQSELVLGADYEVTEGPITCLDCGQVSGAVKMSAACHTCHNRFSAEEALQQSLYGYHIDRLDPVSLAIDQ